MPKAVTVISGEKAGFNCKNNYRYYKLANFWLNTISKVNFRLLVIIISKFLKLE